MTILSSSFASYVSLRIFGLTAGDLFAISYYYSILFYGVPLSDLHYHFNFLLLLFFIFHVHHGFLVRISNVRSLYFSLRRFTGNGVSILPSLNHLVLSSCYISHSFNSTHFLFYFLFYFQSVSLFVQ